MLQLVGYSSLRPAGARRLLASLAVSVQLIVTTWPQLLLERPGTDAVRSPMWTARLQSTVAATAESTPRPRVVAAALLSRPPLLLPQLSPLERTYYAYQRRIHRALAKPFAVSSEWFFKKGSQAEKAFTAFDQRASESEVKDDPTGRRAFEMATEEVEGAPELVDRESQADRTGDVKSLERRADRTLYLLLKKKRSDHAWQFREWAPLLYH